MGPIPDVALRDLGSDVAWHGDVQLGGCRDGCYVDRVNLDYTYCSLLEQRDFLCRRRCDAAATDNAAGASIFVHGRD
jgi:hypothetical protein